jgi:hypothetical protein
MSVTIGFKPIRNDWNKLNLVSSDFDKLNKIFDCHSSNNKIILNRPEHEDIFEAIKIIDARYEDLYEGLMNCGEIEVIRKY